MRLIIIILTIAFLTIATIGKSQTITYSGTDVKLETIFIVIKQQTGYSVLSNAGLIKLAKPITIKAKKIPLETFLQQVLKDQPLEYSIEDKTIIISKKINRENIDNTNEVPVNGALNVRGKIINENGEPVVATVSVKGSSEAISTDGKGAFFLKNIDPNGILVISSINIEPLEVKISGRDDLKMIQVKTRIKEEETVVVANTGYQKVKPNETNGSYVVIDNKKLNEQAGTNIIDRLKGVTNGMLFNANKTDSRGLPNPYTIRGLSTIEGVLTPLIVVDNFPYKGDINNINPADVSSVTILKDAAATSIYGASGGNGVIVITTKRSSFNQKLRVSTNVNTLITEKPSLDKLYQLSSPEYIDLEEYLFNNAFNFNGALLNAYNPVTPAVEIFLKRRDKKISAEDSAKQIDALKQIDSREQLYKYFYQNAVTQQYSLNLSGGSNNLAWLIAGNYDKVVSNLAAQNSRTNIYFRNTYRPVKKATIELGIYYTNTQSKNVGKPAPRPIRNAPYISYVDEYGNPLSVPNQYRESFLETLRGGNLLDWKYYPLEDYKHSIGKARTDEILGNLSVGYQLLKGIDINLYYQYQRQTGETKSIADKESYSVRSLVNSFTDLSYPTTEPQLRNPVPYGNILTQSIAGPRYSNYFRVQGNINKSIGEHNITALVGFEVGDVVKEADFSTAIYNYNTNPSFHGVVDYLKEYRDFVTGTSKTIPGAPRETSTETYNRTISVYSNASYTFRKLYSFSASARKDAANIFGVSTNDKWKPLWSAGMGWQISGERFYHFSALPFFRLKLTYGYTGIVDPSKSAIVRLRLNGTDPDTRMPRAQIPFGGFDNKELRWEKTGQVNIGIDFRSSKNILSGSIEYYSKKSSDLYGRSPIDITNGTESTTKNTADIVSKGVDVQLTTKNINKLLKWSSTLIFNYNTGKVVKYLNEAAQDIRNLVGLDGNKISPIVGKPLYAIVALPGGGLDANGNPQGYDKDGKLSTDYNALLSGNNFFYKGTTAPLFFGSLNNQFLWRNLFFNCNILYYLGYYFRKPALSYQSMLQSGIVPADFIKRWQKPGDEFSTNVPSFIYPVINDSRDVFYQWSEINVLPADHIRLQYVNLGYSFDKNKMQLAFNIANLNMILWRANKENIDPEFPSSNTILPSKIYTIRFSANL